MTVLAADLGGTRIKLGLVRDGAVIAKNAIPSFSEGALADRLPVIADELQGLCRSLDIEPQRCDGVAFAFPSLVDRSGHRVTCRSGKFNDALDLDLGSWADGTFGLPFVIENDARAAAIGEWRHGAGARHNHTDMVMITLGTGIGTAVIVGGRPLRGAGGDAGNYSAHLPYCKNGITCHCGVDGCYEAVSGSWSLPRRASAIAGFADSPLSRRAPLDYEAVFDCASKGDRIAEQLRDGALSAWSDLAVTCVRAYSPALVVFGGGILASREAILGAVKARLRRVAQVESQRVAVTHAWCGDDAALLGLAWLIENRETQW